MNQQPISLQKGAYSPGLANLFLAGLAGYDLRLLPHYAGVLLDHEQKRLVRIGVSVLIPSFLGFWTSFYLFAPFIGDFPTHLLAALAFALLLLVFDCIIVTTLHKAKIFGVVIRLAMSLCIGVVVSEPALLMFYNKTINARIENQLAGQKAADKARLDAELASAKADVSAVDGKLQALQAALVNYSEKNIANLRYKEVEESKHQLLSQLNENKKSQAGQLSSQLDGLESKRKLKREEVEAKMLEMSAEEGGKRASGKAGHGPFWKKLKGELAVLKEDVLGLDKQIKMLENQIMAVQTSKDDEKRINGQFAGPKAVSASLTADEQAEKDRLQKEADAATIQLDGYSGRVKRLETEIGGLNDQYSLAKHDDSLTQTRALYEIAAENQVLLIKIMAFFLLIFFIDVAPVIVKLTVKTDYDDYLKQLLQQKISENLAGNAAYQADCLNAATEKFDRLYQFSEHLTGCLDHTQKNHAHEKTLHRQANLEMRGLIKRLEEPDRAALPFSVWRWFGGVRDVLKLKKRA